ncbi:unnamed protein product [Absidia cylindrospora]
MKAPCRMVKTMTKAVKTPWTENHSTATTSGQGQGRAYLWATKTNGSGDNGAPLGDYCMRHYSPCVYYQQ